METMGSSLYPSTITCLLFLLSCFHLIMTCSSSAKHQLCYDDESSALLQFKQSFSIINQSASSGPSAYPKTASWKLEESSDCCSWDGVNCDDDTGHVIGLDLSSSFLYGSINSSSSLFRLIHLQKISLADNHFNFSHIPSRFGHLSRLTYLNLSQCFFAGQIPSKISQLPKLASLDLSFNVNSSSESLLKLEKPNLNSFVQNLTRLKELHLSHVNVSSAVPDILANFSSLTSILLSDCGLHGEFPIGIFQLPNLKVLDVVLNPHLFGYLPEFNKSSPLKLLKVADTSFSGKLPDSIGSLNSMNELDISDCNFSGSVPSSLGNLTQLTTLDLSSNKFENLNGDTLGWLGKVTRLTILGLAEVNLTSNIPSYLSNLTQLAMLFLDSNKLTGQIPSWLANLTHLTSVSLDGNKLHGQVPHSIYRLVNLEKLSLHSNNLSGTVEFDMFLSLKRLTYLRLGYNNLSLLTKSNINATLPKFKFLGLAKCNLSEFPDFLWHQDDLEVLILSNNRIRGQIPKWIQHVGKETLRNMSVPQKFLTGFDHSPIVLPWHNLQLLNLEFNMLQKLPIPPASTLFYLVSNNSLTGEVSPLICNLTSLQALDLSNNKLSGILPQCLGNFSDSLSVLNLRNNKFSGTIPQLCTNGGELKMIDLNQNVLQGQVPRSLANCKMLEILNLGNNKINDTFPSWLGTLPELRVLIMRSNGFHGAIWSPQTKVIEFSKLHIVDLSYNGFTGKLPSKYFESWNAMKIVNAHLHLTYIGAPAKFNIRGEQWSDNYIFTMEIANKGMEILYAHIPELFTAIDLSSNKFEGEIPESIGNLKGLLLLNLSNNVLTGGIPSCLANLTVLEALDLSQNKLSREIPQQLTDLTFLAFLNVSYNLLMGPIPRGRQFETFQNNSFEGNLGLCGNPLSKKCGNSEASPLPPSTSEQDEDEDEDSKFPSRYDWIFIWMGYGSGLVVGLIVGHTVAARKHEWFVETFGRRPQKRQRKKNRGRRNET